MPVVYGLVKISLWAPRKLSCDCRQGDKNSLELLSSRYKSYSATHNHARQIALNDVLTESIKEKNRHSVRPRENDGAWSLVVTQNLSLGQPRVD